MNYEECRLFIYPYYIFQYREKRIELTKMEGEILSIFMGRKGVKITTGEIVELVYYGLDGPRAPRGVVNAYICRLREIFGRNGIHIDLDRKNGFLFSTFNGFEEREYIQDPNKKEYKKPGTKSRSTARRKVLTKDEIERERKDKVERKRRNGIEYQRRRRASIKAKMELKKAAMTEEEKAQDRRDRMRAKQKVKKRSPKGRPYIRKKCALNPPAPKSVNAPTSFVDAPWHFPPRHPNFETGKWEWSPYDKD